MEVVEPVLPKDFFKVVSGHTSLKKGSAEFWEMAVVDKAVVGGVRVGKAGFGFGVGVAEV